MSFLKIFSEKELGDISKMKGSYRGNFDDDFAHFVLSKDNFFVVKPESMSGDAYDILHKIPVEKFEKVEKVDEKKLKMVIDGQVHLFEPAMKVDYIIDGINKIVKNN